MKLKIERKIQNGETAYLLPFSAGDYEKTLSFTDVDCTTDPTGEIAQVHFEVSDGSLIEQFRKLAVQFEGVDVDARGVSLTLANHQAEIASKCMVNIDLAKDGRIQRLEIV
jgi:hypothetical protein